MTSVVVTTLDLTVTTQNMAGFTVWTDPTSGGVSQENNLIRLGAMSACMYSESTRVTRSSDTSRIFRKAGNMMGRR